MITVEQIEEALLDDYGGCRDINFENPTWAGITDLIRWFFQNYQVSSATNGQGDDVTTELANGQPLPLSEIPEESIHLGGSNPNALIGGLQIFIGNPENDEKFPFVELTFFPSDLNEAFSVRQFVHLVEELKQILQASWYYVRTENVSWKFGSTGFGTGVIFQSSDVQDMI